MMYLSPQSNPPLSLPRERWGQIVTPAKWGKTIQPGRLWAMDNGVFSGKFDETQFWGKLQEMKPYQDSCLFVVAPDVVANALATMDAFRYWGARIRANGWPVAFVAQNGQQDHPLPPEFDALFIGGCTEWKMSQHALNLIAAAKRAGKWVHVGRVNSQKRIRHFQIAAVDSVDGTSVVFAPDKNTKTLDKQLRQKSLFQGR